MALFRILERVAARALLSNSDGWNMRASEANAVSIVADTMQAAAEQRRRVTAACVSHQHLAQLHALVSGHCSCSELTPDTHAVTLLTQGMQ